MSITPDGPLYYLILLLIVGNLFAFFIGVLMLVAPQKLGGVFSFANRWVSTRQISKPLANPHQTDRTLLRYPRVLGAILLVSALLILIKGTIFISAVSVPEGGKLISRLYSGVVLSNVAWELIWIGMIIVIMLGAALAIVVGLMALFQLGTLRGWAESVNRWVSMRQVSKPLETPHYSLDKLVQTRPRFWGGLIILLALFSAIVLWWFVRHV